MTLERDIVDRIRADFGDDAEVATALLREANQSGRVARCIVVSSQGSLDSLIDLIELAIRDPRDAIVAGEYDAFLRQIRDLRVSFLLDTPEKFWASQIACMMASRGYELTSIDSREPTTQPSSYIADRSEGKAIFVGPGGKMEIEKRDRRWSLRDDAEDLKQHNMDRAFDDETRFRDAVSGYLLMQDQ